MIKVGIIGAAGYTAGELLRLLQQHPLAEVVFAQSNSHANEPLWKAHPDLIGDTSLRFCSDINVANNNVDCIFICNGHGKAKAVVHALPESYNGAIIDLSNDFRLHADAEDFTYGLPEAFHNEIEQSKHIANPGCFATCIQLSLLPMAKAGKLDEVHITGVTGSTGAGQNPTATTHFSWRDSNISVYKAFTHQHLGEISETLQRFYPNFSGEINFIPMRGNFTRGIITSSYFNCSITDAEAIELYKSYYANAPFVHIVDESPDLKPVINTNKCLINIKKHGNKLHIVAVIDNLIKGASGQAIQNMNIMFGLKEDTGLRLKESAF